MPVNGEWQRASVFNDLVTLGGRAGRIGARSLGRSERMPTNAAGSPQFFGQKNGLRHLHHGLPAVHARLLDPPKRLALAEPLPLHEETLGALDDFTGIESLLQVLVLAPDRFELSEASHRQVDGRSQFLGAEG